MGCENPAGRIVKVVLAFISASSLIACSSFADAKVPIEIKSVLAAKGTTRVTLFRILPSNERVPSEFHLMPVEARVELPEADAARVVSVLGSGATYGNDHLGCVSVGYGLRVERGGRSVDLIVDLRCDHLLDAETGHDIGLLSRAGHEFFQELLGHPHTADGEQCVADRHP